MTYHTMSERSTMEFRLTPYYTSNISLIAIDKMTYNIECIINLVLFIFALNTFLLMVKRQLRNSGLGCSKHA